MKINASIYEVDSMLDDYNLGLAPDINKNKKWCPMCFKGDATFLTFSLRV